MEPLAVTEVKKAWHVFEDDLPSGKTKKGFYHIGWWIILNTGTKVFYSHKHGTLSVHPAVEFTHKQKKKSYSLRDFKNRYGKQMVDVVMAAVEDIS